MSLNARLTKLEAAASIEHKLGVVLVDVGPGQSWAEAVYMAMLNVTGPAVYMPRNKGA